jgi:hypothetical protein
MWLLRPLLAEEFPPPVHPDNGLQFRLFDYFFPFATNR